MIRHLSLAIVFLSMTSTCPSAPTPVATNVPAPAIATSTAPTSTATSTAPTSTATSTAPTVPSASSILHDEAALHAAVERAIATFMGHPKNLDVTLVSAPGLRGRAGYFKEMSIRLEDTTVKTLRVRYAWIRLTDCAISLKELTTKGTLKFITEGQADLVGYVEEKDLNDLFKLHSKTLRVEKPKFDFLPGRLRFSGRVLTRFFTSFITVEGKLSVRNGTHIYFHPHRVKAGWFAVPQIIVRRLANGLNPIADFSTFKFNVNLRTVKTTDNRLYMATAAMAEELERLITEAKNASKAAPR